jgi:hypothetical protein
MQKRQANPKLPSKSLILIGSRQGTDGKSLSSSAWVRGRSSSCSVTADAPSGCRLARGTRPESFSKARKDSSPIGYWEANKLIPLRFFDRKLFIGSMKHDGVTPSHFRSVAIYNQLSDDTVTQRAHADLFPGLCTPKIAGGRLRHPALDRLIDNMRP